MPKAESTAPAAPSVTRPVPTHSSGSPPSHQSAHTAAAKCTAARADARTPPWSSHHPTAATASPPPASASACPGESQPATPSTASKASVTSTIATPPPRGVGTTCELRSLGWSSTSRARA